MPRRAFLSIVIVFVIFTMIACLSFGANEDKGIIEESEPAPTNSLTPSPSPSPSPTSTHTQTPTPIPTPVWTFFSNENLERSEDFKQAAIDSQGYVWVTGFGGVIKWDLSNKDNETWNLIEGQEGKFKKLMIDSADRVWAATDDLLFRYDGVDWREFNIPGDGATFGLVEGASQDIWVCSGDGVQRLSGDSWQTYGKEEGLLEDSCFAISVDQDQNPWIISRKNSLSRFTNSWENYTIPEEFLETIDDDPIDTIFANIHISPTGEVWVKSLYQVTRFDQNGWDIRSATASGERIDAFGLSSTGQPWAAYVTGGKTLLTAFDGTQWVNMMSESLYDGIPYTGFNSIFGAPDGSMWFLSEDMFIRKYLVNTEQVYMDAHGAWNPIHNLGYDFYDDGRMIYVSNEGILELFPDNDDVILHQGSGALASNSIIDLQIAPDGTVWTMHGEKFQDTSLQRYDETGWSTYFQNTEIEKFLVDEEGYIWALVNGGYLYKSNEDWSDWVHLSYSDGLVNYDVDELFKDSQGNIWLGHYNTLSNLADTGGASLWDGDQWIRFSCAEPNSPDCPGVFGFAESPGGIIWAVIRSGKYDKTLNYYMEGTWYSLPETVELPVYYYQFLFNRWDEPVILAYEDEEWKILEVKDQSFIKETTLPGNISHLYYHENTLWIATLDQGLYYREDSENTSGVILQVESPLWEGQELYTIQAGQDGKIWMGSQNNIYFYDGTQWYEAPEPKDAGFENVYQIEAADDGTMWFGSLTDGVAWYGLP